MTSHSQTADLAVREKHLLSMQDTPLEFLDFEDPVHENAHLLSAQQKEVADANEKVAVVLQETRDLIEKKERERQLLLQRQRKVFGDFLDKQAQQLLTAEETVVSAKAEEDPFKKQTLLASISLSFQTYKGVMPDGDDELTIQKAKFEEASKEVAALLWEATEVVDEIEARQLMEEMLSKQRHDYSMHLQSQQTMLQAFSLKLEEVLSVLDVKDRL